MFRRAAFPLFVAVLALAALISKIGGADSADATSGSVAGPVAAHAAASSSLTARAAAAAEAFKSSLSSAQQSKMQFSFSDSRKQSGWSNLPTSLVARNGVRIADLSSAQVAKLRTLLKTILSSQGYGDEEATRKADTYLAAAQSSGSGAAAPGGTPPSGTTPTGPPAGSTGTTPASPGGAQGQLSYGEGLYYVAFYGTPSTSRKWTVQFGGHHLAIHMTFSGSTVSNTPYFVGVEPRTAFKVDGKTYQPMKDEAAALFGAAQSLTATQKTKAKLGQTFDDVVVGPQADGKFPAKQGITVSTLSAGQRALVIRAIKAYLFDMPTTQARRILAVYEQQFPQTKLAYSGKPDGTTTGGYVRLHGPRLWLEIATQNGIVLSRTHYHSIERDIKTDYGAGT